MSLQGEFRDLLVSGVDITRLLRKLVTLAEKGDLSGGSGGFGSDQSSLDDIDFEDWTTSNVIGTEDSPVSGALTTPVNPTGLSGVQKIIFHLDSESPEVEGFEKDGTSYSPNVLNIITLTYIAGTIFISYFQPVSSETPSIELIPTGFAMVDGDANGQADGVTTNVDSSGNTTPQVLSDGANGFSGGYQEIAASTGTSDSHFCEISNTLSGGNMEANTSYRIQFKYRSTAPIAIQWSGPNTWASITNNTHGTVSGGNVLTLPVNTGDAILVEFDILTGVAASKISPRFTPNVASPNLYQFQVGCKAN